MALFLLIVIVAIGLGVVGAVVKGLLYLLVLGVVVFLLNLVFLGTRMRRKRPNR